MALLENWQKIAYNEKTNKQELQRFWQRYFLLEKGVYEQLLENPDQYITKVGRVLRKTSLDELPQIWDIFRGTMSIIGPRPALWNQADLVEERDRYGANDVLPGLTGLAQVHGRNTLKWEKRFEMDVSYTAHVTFIGDLKIILDTIWTVVLKKNIMLNGLEDFDVYRKRRMESKMGMEYTNSKIDGL